MGRIKFPLALVSVFLVAFSCIYFGETIHRRDFDRASFAWLREPTPSNEANLRREQHKTEKIRIMDSGIVAVTATFMAFAICKTAKYIKQRR